MNIHSKKFASIEMASYVTETSGSTENSSLFSDGRRLMKVKATSIISGITGVKFYNTFPNNCKIA